MTKSHVVALVAVAGLMFLSLAACSAADSDNGDPLDGTQWVLTVYGKTKPIPGTVISATFEEGQLRGNAGCNSYSGSYQVDGDTVTFGPIAITEMFCMEPEGVMDQETEFMAFLSDAKTFRLTDEQLQILRSDGEALTFAPGPE